MKWPSRPQNRSPFSASASANGSAAFQAAGGRAKLAISASLITPRRDHCRPFVVLPISVRYLGNEGYRLMATITAVVGWLRFATISAFSWDCKFADGRDGEGECARAKNW